MNARNGVTPVHSGKALRDHLDELGLSASALSKALWKIVDERSQVRIFAELERLGDRLVGTQLAIGRMAAHEIIYHHRKTFEMTRYYNEMDPARAPNELTHNVEL